MLLLPLKQKIRELEGKPQRAQVTIESVRRMLLRLLRECEEEQKASQQTYSPRISHAKFARAKELIEAGLTDEAVAKEVKIGVNTVPRIRKVM